MRVDGDILEAVREAMDELAGKDMKQIQVETAVKWCGRALAARLMGLPDRDVTEFAHEAVEHAALSGVDPVLAAVRAALDELGIET